MATIQKRKIATRNGIAPGGTRTVNWNYTPDTVLGYFAYPLTTPASGEHGTSIGSVEITNVRCTWEIHNDKDDKKFVSITVKNVGSDVVGFDLYQSWIE